MLKAKCFAVTRRDSGDDFVLLLIMLTALNHVSESPPGSSGGQTDSGVSILRRQARGMRADTMPESDDPRSAETRSAANGRSVYAASSEMPSWVGDTICPEEDRRLLSIQA